MNDCITLAMSPVFELHAAMAHRTCHARGRVAFRSLVCVCVSVHSRRDNVILLSLLIICSWSDANSVSHCFFAGIHERTCSHQQLVRPIGPQITCLSPRSLHRKPRNATKPYLPETSREQHICKRMVRICVLTPPSVSNRAPVQFSHGHVYISNRSDSRYNTNITSYVQNTMQQHCTLSTQNLQHI